MISCEKYEQEFCESLVDLIANIKNNSYGIISKPEPILNKIKDSVVLNDDEYKLKLAKDVELKLNELMRHYFHLAQYKNGNEVIINIAGAFVDDISSFLSDNLVKTESLNDEDKKYQMKLTKNLVKTNNYLLMKQLN